MRRILVLGSGGREHAIVWRLAQDKQVDLFALPGNPGTRMHAKNVDLPLHDHDAIAKFCSENLIDLTVVGPEQPLVEGIVDLFRFRNLKIIGPDAKAAMLEGSKAYAKECMSKWGIPTAQHKTFSREDYPSARSYLRQLGAPVVLKASGLAAGKGVLVCHDIHQAEKGLEEIMVGGAFGDAGQQVVIEEFMEGEEASVFALCSGDQYVLLPSAQDHKRIGEGDTGLNTGGMGAYSPAPVVTQQVTDEVCQTIIEPLLSGCSQDGTPYTGFLFVGLMIHNDKPRVVEFNCRLGDPETQVILPRIAGSFTDLLFEAASGKIRSSAAIRDSAAACVVLASGGYPETYEVGKEIEGLGRAEILGKGIVFHAGTQRTDAGDIVTSGGRVLGATGMGNSIRESIRNAYQLVEEVDFDGKYFRKDIAARALTAVGEF